MTETREIPTILRRGKEVEFASDGDAGALVMRVVPLVARDYIETLDTIAAAYAELAGEHETLAAVPAVDVIAKLVRRLPELQAKSLRWDGRRVPTDWVLDNLDAADVSGLIGHILDVNRIEEILANLGKARERVEGVLAGLRPLSSSAAPSDETRTVS